MNRFQNGAAALTFAMAASLGLGQTSASTPPPSVADNGNAGGHDKASPGIKSLFWQPNELGQGSPAFFTVEFERAPKRVAGRWIGKQLTFFKSSNPKIWYALAGADLETQPGSYDVNLTAVTATGKTLHAVKALTIRAGSFESSEVSVPENFVTPDAAEKKEIAADRVLKSRAFARATPTPLWSGSFIKPVEAKSTATFGATRLFNEELTSTHRGTDFPIAEGAPVVVSNDGAVVLARELFYEGNCVIVDHGDRLFTIYMHMSKLAVHAGQKVKKGDRLGLTGKTGRVTGPHLHMGVRWDGAYLDPTELLALTLPRLHEEGMEARHVRRR